MVGALRDSAHVTRNRRSKWMVVFRSKANSSNRTILTIQSFEIIAAKKLSKIGRKAQIAQAAAEGRPSEGLSGPNSPIPKRAAAHEPKVIAIATDLAFGLIRRGKDATWRRVCP